MKKLLSLLLVLALCCSMGTAFASSKTITGDDFIVDTLDGVPAYPTRQCNELVIRYYWEVLGVDMFVGDYSPFLSSNFDVLFSDIEDLGDIPDELSGFQHTDAPKKGDIVYWSAARRGKSYAHSALVKSYQNGVITLIEQNWNYKGTAAYERQVKFPSEEYVVYTLPAEAISLVAGEAYQPVGGELAASEPASEGIRSSSRLWVNGEEVALTAYHIGGNNYFKLAELGVLLNFGVDYEPNTKTVLLTSR